MTVQRALDLQERVFEIVSDAVLPFGEMPVFDHAPTDPPPEFIRIDGFNIADQSMKNGEIGRHSFMVNHFLRPVGETMNARGQSRSKEVLAAVHADLMAAEILGSTLNFEFQDVMTDIDGATAHVFCRYSITLT